MFSLATFIGLIAATFTTACYIPQLYRCWTTRSTGDLSLAMLAAMTSGVMLWIVYGILQADFVVILANVVSLLLLLAILFFKLTENRATASAQQ